MVRAAAAMGWDAVQRWETEVVEWEWEGRRRGDGDEATRVVLKAVIGEARALGGPSTGRAVGSRRWALPSG